MPVVDADDAEDPGARPTDRADLHDRLVEDVGVELIAAIAPRLQPAKQPGVLEVGKSLVREATQPLGLHRALAQHRQQITHAPQILFRRHSELVLILSSRRRPGPVYPRSRALLGRSRPAPG